MEARHHPTSFRPSPQLDARLNALASRTGMSKNALVQTLADEGERAWRYPGIAFRGLENHRRAWLTAGGGDIWEIIRTLAEFGGDVDRMSNEIDVAKGSIRLAQTYYREFPEEIDALLDANSRSLDEWQHDYPFVEVARTGPRNAQT